LGGRAEKRHKTDKVYNFGGGKPDMDFLKLNKAKLYPENELQFLNFASPHAQGYFVAVVPFYV
jgi:hypothetical protein